jgi:carbon-monoxide dehydrogenase large subunit
VSFLQSRSHSAQDGFGKPVLRKEDARLLVGRGCYSDDVNLLGQGYACFVRSPHAHARIGRIDTTAARNANGVIAVFTGEDAVADGMKPLTHTPMPGNPYEEMIRDRNVSFIAPHPPMPADRARFVGEVVAMVVAETPAAARDGAERVRVDWTPLPAVTSAVAAAAPTHRFCTRRRHRTSVSIRPAAMMPPCSPRSRARRTSFAFGPGSIASPA